MHDEELKIDDRLAAAIGIYGGSEFRPVPRGRETELKALVNRHSYDDFALIRNAVDSKSNRVLDPRTYVIRDTALVTLNLDTLDQKFRKAGLSARVRFAFDPHNLNAGFEKIDISVKTRLSNGTVIYLTSERGEWEGKLDTLTPDFSEIVKQNGQARKNEKPIPQLITSGIIKPDDSFIESVGATWRRTYISTHLLPCTQFAAIYEHTEDCNIFTTPYCDIPATMRDREAEAEIKGIMGEGVHKLPDCEYQSLSDISLKKTTALIENLSSTIRFHKTSKSQRGSEAVRRAYQGLDVSGFNGESFCPVHYSLQQRQRPEDIKLGNLANQMARLQHEISRQEPKNSWALAAHF